MNSGGNKAASLLQGRSLWVYYFLFFSGTFVLVYQSFDLKIIGDSVNVLCLLCMVSGFFVGRPLYILENSVLVTLGYILPLLIRNSLKLSYVEAPSAQKFLELAFISSLITLALGILFSSAGFIISYAIKKFRQAGRSKITTRSLSED